LKEPRFRISVWVFLPAPRSSRKAVRRCANATAAARQSFQWTWKSGMWDIRKLTRHDQLANLPGHFGWIVAYSEKGRRSKVSIGLAPGKSGSRPSQLAFPLGRMDVDGVCREESNAVPFMRPAAGREN
jgi:hypothetical protein